MGQTTKSQRRRYPGRGNLKRLYEANSEDKASTCKGMVIDGPSMVKGVEFLLEIGRHGFWDFNPGNGIVSRFELFLNLAIVFLVCLLNLICELSFPRVQNCSLKVSD